MREISNQNEIKMFVRCVKCIKERPPEESADSFGRLSVGWTVQGIQVWCVRHQCNVIHIDFDDRIHHVNTNYEPDRPALKLCVK